MDHLGTVHTPRGTPVTVWVHTIELTPAQIAAYNADAARLYPLATRETDATRRYNCHTYAWFSTDPAVNVWMNDPGDNTYWLNGSYIEWRPPLTYFAGMTWSWSEGDHSGIELGSNGAILSK